MIQPSRCAIHVNNQNISRNRLSFNSLCRKVLDTLEKYGVQICNMKFKFQQIAVDNTIIIVSYDFVNV